MKLRMMRMMNVTESKRPLTPFEAREVVWKLAGATSFTKVHRDEFFHALDDLEDALMRSHDALGCDLDADVVGRYVCMGCRTTTHARRVVNEGGWDPDAEQAGRAEAPASDRIVVGTVTLPVYVDRRDVGVDLDLSFSLGEATHRRAEMLKRRISDDPWDDVTQEELDAYEAYEASLTADERAARDATRRRIRLGVDRTREPAEGWDAAADVRRDRDADAAADEAHGVDVIDEIGD